VVFVRPYIVDVRHVVDCPRLAGRYQGRRRCAEGCKKVTAGYEVDIKIRLPSGKMLRERVRSPVTSKSGSADWGRARETLLLREGTREKKVQTPTLAEFWPEFLAGYIEANRHKPSTIVTTKSIYKIHLEPAFGAKRLDAIADEDVQKLKGALADRSPKTVNNVLTVLGKALRIAVKWKRLERLPCDVALVKVQRPEVEFYEPADYERLVDGASLADERTYVLSLLGGDAGLRIGEIIALEWTDLDMKRRLVKVQRSEWQGAVSAPKGGQSRTVPMTARLATALEARRGPRTRVLTKDDGTGIDWDWAREKMRTAQRRAGMKPDGKLHKLRHTFGARLAMSGAPAMTIKELMGHADLTTTMRYMHLTPAHKEAAIRRLELGDSWETSIPAGASNAPGQKKAPPNLTLGGAQMVTPTGLEPMFST